VELEDLRRRVQQAQKTAGGIDDAIDKGWIGSDIDAYRVRAADATQAAGTFEQELRDRVEYHKKHQTGVIPLWVSVHLRVCADILQAPNTSPTRLDVREVCIGTLLSELGNISHGGHMFSVNDYYLSDYNERLDRQITSLGA
jgi:hypothetical protein